MAWHKAVSPEDHLQYKDHDNLAHYADATVDIQFKFPFSSANWRVSTAGPILTWKCTPGLLSGRKQFFDPELNESYVPFVVETSVGCDRMFLSVVSNALVDETVADANSEETTRTVMRIHPALSPVKVAILPLVKNKRRSGCQSPQHSDRLKLDFQCQLR
ncbi:MAG: hypothetical protein R2792_14560 [Saprospiraceae bacterium]